MLQRYSLSLVFLILGLVASAQSTGMEVYQIMQTYCTSCHNADNPPAGLNLVGQGSTAAQRWGSVYQKIVYSGSGPGNANASGGAVVYPGRPDRSFLFRKINNGLDPHLGLSSAEGQAMPPYGQPAPTEKEVEIIRQWILFGARQSGTQMDADVVADFYENGGLQAFPDGAPEAPAPEDGFQIKFGPFYLAPGNEQEYFQRFELDLPADLEVNRIQVEMGTYSHHFIIYDWDPGADSQVQHGLRPYSFHNSIKLVAAVQGSEDLQLPAGTAFRWEKGLVLDLNSHYINYSATQPYQAEVYVNVYTQPAGTAIEEMHSELLANIWIPIPNNGDEITHTEHINYNLGDVYVWALMGHTHRYGTGYKVWTRSFGVPQQLIYDAACPQGIPGCSSPYFDYQHIPIRLFDPLLPVPIDFYHGIIHQATWINDGPVPVAFGPTSDDEMMVLAVMYTSNPLSGINDPTAALERVEVYPVPAEDNTRLILPSGIGEVSVALFDATGRAIRAPLTTRDNIITIARNGLPPGMYYYEIRHESGVRKSGRIVFQ